MRVLTLCIENATLSDVQQTMTLWGQSLAAHPQLSRNP